MKYLFLLFLFSSTSLAQTIDIGTATNGPVTMLGDVTNSSSSSVVLRINGTPVSATAPTGQQVLTYNSTVSQWIPGGSVSFTKYTKTYSDLSTNANSNSITLFSLPAGTILDKVVIKTSTAFTGGSVSAYTLSVGISGNNTKYASAFDIFQAVGATVFQLSNSSNIENFTSGTNITITATSTGDTLNHATAGSVDIYILTKPLF